MCLGLAACPMSSTTSFLITLMVCMRVWQLGVIATLGQPSWTIFFATMTILRYNWPLCHSSLYIDTLYTSLLLWSILKLFLLFYCSYCHVLIASLQVKMLVLLGEVGGVEEYEVVEALKTKRIVKPIVAWCIGTCAGACVWVCVYGAFSVLYFSSNLGKIVMVIFYVSLVIYIECLCLHVFRNV